MKNVQIPRYVDTFEEEEEIDVLALQQEIEELEENLQGVRCQMASLLQEVALS